MQGVLVRCGADDILQASPRVNNFALWARRVLWESPAMHRPGGNVHDGLRSFDTLEVHVSHMPHMHLYVTPGQYL